MSIHEMQADKLKLSECVIRDPEKLHLDEHLGGVVLLSQVLLQF
jgi:hypothetical protein